MPIMDGHQHQHQVQPQTPQPKSYLIIGSGVFGASTALALKTWEHEAEVTVLDRTPFPCPYAAGHDLNKICRGDYGDLMYMKLAIKSLDAWTKRPLYNQHFHNPGLLYAYDKAYLESIIATWEKIYGEGKAPSYLLDPADAKQKFKGIFRDADWDMATQSLWSPTAGWADSAGALHSVMQAAVDLGVNYIDTGAANVIFDDSGACIGAETTDGKRITADRTILAAGAFIPFLLVESAPKRPELHIGDRLVAVGCPMSAYKVPDSQREKFKECPVMALMATLPAECIPPGDKQLLKCTHDTGFSNNVYHHKSKQKLSIPPSKTSQLTWSQDMPQVLKDELRTVLKELYGDWVSDLETEYYRMCWDGYTPNQDFIMCQHPKADNLYVVGGGSFHAFKFLPVIGDVVVQMLRGDLDEEMKQRFAWDRPDNGNHSPQFAPRRDLADLW